MLHHFPPARRLIPPPLPRPSLSLSLSFTVVACRFAPRRRRSCATQPAGRVDGPARVEFSPQAGQPNGNKKLRQTALPTPQRPVNIVAERERERRKEGERERAWPKAAPTTAAYTVSRQRILSGSAATLQRKIGVSSGQTTYYESL